MKDEAKIAEALASLASTVERLGAQVERLESVNKKRGIDSEADERFMARIKRLDAIAAIADDAERARATAALGPVDDVKHVIGELNDARLLATLEAATPNERSRIRVALTPSREMQIAATQLPAPRRVRVKIAPSDFAPANVQTMPINGLTKAEHYPGWGLRRGEAWVELASTWARRVDIDAQLRDLVASGAIVVADVSEAESKGMLLTEILQLSPEDRPQLMFESGPARAATQ